MTIRSNPYQETTLDEDKDKRYKILRVRLNQQEQALLQEIKEMLNVAQDSKGVKISMVVARNVLHTLFGRKLGKYLFKNERVKLEDFKDF